MSAMHAKSENAIGIVGGGQAGLRFLTLLSRSELARPVFVVDPMPDAPAVLAAREAGVATYMDIGTAIQNTRADMIFELVGRPEVLSRLQHDLEGSQIRLVDHSVAYTILTITEEDQQRTRNQVSTEIDGVKKEIGQSLDGSREVVGEINRIMNSLQMLALNASIEAAKVGVHGKGFMVVAEHMSKSVEAVRKMTHEIEAMNGNIQRVSEKIDLALEHLR